MPIVQVTLLEGRTKEQKRKTAERITQAMHEECGANVDGVVVTFVEIPRDNYARGGVLMSDKAK